MTGNNTTVTNEATANGTILDDRDSVLVDFVSWANRGVTMGLTLSINGSLYSGKLISGASWCDAMIKQSEASDSHESTIKSLVEYYTSMKNHYYGSPEVEPDLIGYIHLEEVAIFQGNNTEALPKTLWRFKIRDIEGFSVGHWTKN